MKQKTTEILASVSHLSEGDRSDAIYDDWSESYDNDLLDEFGYISPRVAVETLTSHIKQSDIDIVDYGCGTGLVGVELDAAGFRCFDGIDISSGMLQQARDKGVYRNLIQGDLTTSIALDYACYDAALCIGSMGAGHVGAQHINEMLRPLRDHGLFIIILNGAYYLSGGFDRAFQALQDDGLWRIEELREFNYMSELVRPGWLLCARKNG